SVLAFAAGCGSEEPAPAAEASVIAPKVDFDTLVNRVRTGESFNSIARNLDVAESESSLLLTGIREHFGLKLYAGQVYRVVFRIAEGARELHTFILEDRFSEHKHVLTLAAPRPEALISASLGDEAPTDKGYIEEPRPVYEKMPIPVRIDTVAVSGVLNTNLYDAFLSRGETGALIHQVTKIFAWDIDFFKDPRVGDEFALLVEKRYGEDGAFRGYGQILSAKYSNRGQDFCGILYNGSYFNEEGRSMEKMLMKAPLNFARVTSNFSRSRMHPVLGVARPHWGIDYGGPLGTKILAAGDGKVEYSKWVNGYGKTIKIRHNGVYNTYYAHLNGYASGIQAGRRVKQGEVIGYMGKTGLATGVHLDYRVEYNGSYINPASLKMESKQGVDKGE